MKESDTLILLLQKNSSFSSEVAHSSTGLNCEQCYQARTKIFSYWPVVERFNQTFWSTLPLPFITKLNKFLLDLELYNNYAWKDRNKSEETQKQYEEKKKQCMEKQEDNENMVVLSLVVESSIESSFQVGDVQM